MTTYLVLQGPALNDSKAANVADATAGQLIRRNHFYKLALPAPLSGDELVALRRQYDFDINIVPDGFNPARAGLVIMDMDSTLVSIECIDEVADFIAVKPQVAEITASAMRGEIDFETSLQRRLALLIGLDDSVLQQVYDERLALSPGAETMIAGVRRHGIKLALVSGGFTYFTDRLKTRLGLDFTLANELKFADGKLAGLENDIIVGARSKADFLLDVCGRLDISPDQAVAVGDGANDLLMMEQAGLSVAYHAKPTVQQQAATALNYCGLDGVLGLLDIDS